MKMLPGLVWIISHYKQHQPAYHSAMIIRGHRDKRSMYIQLCGLKDRLLQFSPNMVRRSCRKLNSFFFC